MYKQTKKEKEASRIESLAFLKETVKPGDCVNLTLSHVSRSGMSRIIKCIVTDGVSGNLSDISWHVARVCELPHVEGYNGGVRIGGCGMDMGLALIDCLSYAVYGKPVDQRGSWAMRNLEEGNGGLRYKWL